MARYYFSILLVIALLPSALMAEWIPLNQNKTKENPPVVTLLSSDESGAIFRIDLSGFELKNVIIDGKSYQTIDLLTQIFVSDAGSPELPYISSILALHDQAGATVEVLETGNFQTFNNITLPPACKSNWEGKHQFTLAENSDIYNSANLYPQNMVSIDSPSVFRDFRIARVSVFPITYNPLNKEIKVTTSITVKVNFGKSQTINPKTSSKKKIALSFGKIYQSSILNYNEILKANYGGKEDGHEVMLCIMPDIFYNSFQEYATWKRQSGIDIHITKFSDIGANSTNPITIKNHIIDAYLNWENPPTYVLLVGDDGLFPEKIVTHDNWSFPWEEYFVTVEGNDYFPEMMVGRFTHETDNGLKNMVNKFELYEKSPYITDTTWFKKGLCTSNDEYDSQVSTKRFTYNLMKNYGAFTQVDTMMSSTICNYDINDVKTAINDGRSFINYRGEGWTSGWGAHCTPLDIIDLPDINNGQKMPFITSIGCGVAMFEAQGGNCFGEEWIEMGTKANPKGAACFIGPTSNTHTTYNNYIDKGIYTGMFKEGMTTPGQAILRGKLYMYNQFGNTDPMVEYHYHVFCILGDPSIRIWKDIPLPVTCTHPITGVVDTNEINISVVNTATGLPVDSAEVYITGKKLFIKGLTGINGIANMKFVVDTSENILTVTVRGENIYPCQGEITINKNTSINDIGITSDGLINQNRPNPFNSDTEISYYLSNDGFVNICVYDTKGVLVKTLINSRQTSGAYSVKWNGTDNNGTNIDSGVYFYKFQTDKYTKTRKMIKL